jgi:hypothetical protein
VILLALGSWTILLVGWVDSGWLAKKVLTPIEVLNTGAEAMSEADWGSDSLGFTLALVSDDTVRLKSLDEGRRFGHVGHLPGGQTHAQGIAQRFDCRMNFGAQPTQAPSDGLIARFIFGAGRVLVGSHDGRVDEQRLQIGIALEDFGHPGPNAFLAQREKHMYAVYHAPKCLGRSRHGEPVRAIHNTLFDKEAVAAPGYLALAGLA